MAEGEDAQGVEEGAEEGGGEAVVGWGGEGQDVDEGVVQVGCAAEGVDCGGGGIRGVESWDGEGEDMSCGGGRHDGDGQ